MIGSVCKSTGAARRAALGVVSAALLAAGPAAATILSGSVTSGGGASFVKLDIPLTGSVPLNTVGADNFQSPNLFAFDESQNTTLTAALAPDIGAALAAGTTVASHYVFFDPTSGRVTGTVNFDADILAVLSSTGTLAATDYLANTGVNYLNPSLRGLEAGDLVTVSGARQISIDFTASSPGDYVRVLTAFSPGAAVPEPSAAALVALALAGLALSRRKKRQA